MLTSINIESFQVLTDNEKPNKKAVQFRILIQFIY